ncbi:MAG: hypothetical protein U5K55_10590 [Aliarcobacter sp.]|nr:hypothetical protein [Aliarcobacter sp.]
MVYLEEIFYISCSFLFGYFLFKYDIFKSLAKNGIINKDFSECYILKYPKNAELHNKNFIYKIDIEEFFKLNPKLKGKIKVIERPEIDSTKAGSVKKELEERKKIKEEFNNSNFWQSRKKDNNKTA